MGISISTERRDGILLIEINRPEKKNALTLAMYTALAEVLKQAEADATVRAMLLHGQPEVFSSGNDLHDFASFAPDRLLESQPAYDFLFALSGATKPVVAAVNGGAIGIGTTLLLHCDLVYAGEQARFQLPFVNLGLCPEGAASLLLPMLMGHRRAAELLLLGEPFSARKAWEIGLVNEILPDSQVLDHALARARQLAAQPPASVRLTKRMIKQEWVAAVGRTLRAEAVQFAERLQSPEAKEAFQAFFEPRAPDFSRFE